MPTAIRVLWITFAVFFLVAVGSAGTSNAGAPTALSGPAVAPAPELRETAKAALDKVSEEATRWHADAELIWVGAIVDAEGFSNNDGAMSSRVGVSTYAYPDGWNYTFSSPSAQKRLYIRVYRGGLATSEMGFIPEQPRGEPGQQGGEVSKPLPRAFLDSDQAMAVARKNGFSVKGAGYHYQFHMELPNSQSTAVNEPYCWQVKDDDGTSFFVSAKSGKLLAKVPAGN